MRNRYLIAGYNMRVHSINTIKSANHQKIKVTQHSQQPSFQGHVNGNYYKDEIIKLAKENLNNPTWKDTLRGRKESVGHAVKNWHHDVYWSDNGEFDSGNRVLLGIFTLGASEVIMNAKSGVSAAVHNRHIEDTINEVAKCMDDMKYCK